jgi:hypothetical protein
MPLPHPALRGDLSRDDIWTVSSLFTPPSHCA